MSTRENIRLIARASSVTTLVPSFLDGSSSFLQVTRRIIKAWKNLNFGKIPSSTTESPALERLKNQ